MNDDRTIQLSQLVTQRLRILEELLEMGRRQREVVAAGDTERLMTLLVAKHKLLRQLQVIERSLDPFREEDPESRRWRSPQDRAACRAAMERSTQILRQIEELDRHAESELVKQRAATEQQLQGLDHAHQARSAYLDVGGGVPSRLDLDAG